MVESDMTKFPLEKHDYVSVTQEQYDDNRVEMRKAFKQTEMLRQLRLYTDRSSWKQEDDLTQWFLQSRDRLAIFHLFNLNGYPDGFTVGMVSRRLELPRTTTSRLLMDCYKKRFITKNPEEGKSRYYMPSERLLCNGDYWCEYYIDTILGIEGEPERSMFFGLKKIEYLTRKFNQVNVTP